MTEEETYRLLVQQRIQNRIIEYFGIVVEFESDPGAMSFNGLVNQWEMYVDHPFTSSEYPAPAFTDKEVNGLPVPGRETGISASVARCINRKSVTDCGFVSIKTPSDRGDGADSTLDALLSDPRARFD